MSTNDQAPIPTPDDLERIRDILFGDRARGIEESVSAAATRLHDQIVGLRADLDALRAACDARFDEQAERAVERRQMASLLREWADRLDSGNG